MLFHNVKILIFIATATTSFAATICHEHRSGPVRKCDIWHTVDMAKLLELKGQDSALRFGMGPTGPYLITLEACYRSLASDPQFALLYPRSYEFWERIMEDDEKIRIEREKHGTIVNLAIDLVTVMKDRITRGSGCVLPASHRSTKPPQDSSSEDKELL